MDEGMIAKMMEEISVGMEDARGDNPEVGEQDLAWEIMNSVCAGHSVEVHNEVRRRMGFDPLVQS